MELTQNHYLLKNDIQLLSELADYLHEQGVDSSTALFARLDQLGIGSLKDLQAYTAGPDCPTQLSLLWDDLALRVKQLRFRSLQEFTSSSQTGFYLSDQLGSYDQERLVAVYLDSRNHVIAQKTIFVGTLDKTTAQPRDIFRWAVYYNAASFIMSHNHPSGRLTPSEQDLSFSRRLNKLADLMNIRFLDHFIVNEKEYLSFRELEFF